MMATFIEVLRSWQNFYFMAGGAAATLIGLMFVAISLGIGAVDEAPPESFRIFAAPSIFYFVSALLICCVMLVPSISPTALAVIMILGMVIGLILTVPRVIKLIQTAFKQQDFDLGDWLAQIVSPVVSYLLTGIGAVCITLSQWEAGIVAIWLATVSLLVSAIANTWSLVIWIIEQRHR